MDRYLVGAAVQYSYSLFVLLQGGDLQQEEKYGKWGHSPRREGNTSSNAPPWKEDKCAFSFIHSLTLLIYSFYFINFIQNLLCASTALDTREPSTEPVVPVLMGRQ